MEYDRHMLNSNNVMKTSWKLINKELGKNYNNYGFQSVNINGRSITDLQSIASAFNKHFTIFPTIIS
jgi:transketolase N-terminal domain/subunit